MEGQEHEFESWPRVVRGEVGHPLWLTAPKWVVFHIEGTPLQYLPQPVKSRKNPYCINKNKKIYVINTAVALRASHCTHVNLESGCFTGTYNITQHGRYC